MIIQKVEMPARQSLDLRQRVVHVLYIERAAAFIKGFLIAEVTGMRTAARDDDRVGNEVEMPLDEIAADTRKTSQSAGRGAIETIRTPGAKIGQKRRPDVLARTKKYRVSVSGGLLRQGGDVQSAKRDVDTPVAIVIGDLVGAPRR